MCHDTEVVSWLDLVLLALLVVAALLGYRRGAVLQLFTYGGLLLGLLVGSLLAPITAGAVDDPATGAGIAVATLLIAGALGDLVGWIVGGLVRPASTASIGHRADAAGGSLVAVIAVLLAIWVISLNLVNGPVGSVAGQIRRSAVVRGIDDVLPRPPSLLTEARRWFNSLGFPDLFSGIPPIPGAPVATPPQGLELRAFRAARQSTVRVVGEACDEVLTGSGFIAGPGLIVTNAHVIAGEREPRVETAGSSQAATPVVFDPGVDIAVLRVSDAPGPTLDLSAGLPPRGTGGAVVGYPGGGGLAGTAAAVRGTLEATGPSITGDREIRRTLVELQTSVVPGNSGGPFVLEGGAVSGVVVSSSTSDPQLGYAIASTEVAPLLERARTSTAPVATGPCLR
ncbi:MAG: MarP family serine protease [Actinomycetota bacterium]